jgi:outer membrane protein assembly factor BamB
LRTGITTLTAGFGGKEAVDIYFGTRDKALAVTNSKGSFSGRRISVPASATPGAHWITLVGRRTGRAAQTRFVVRTNWTQFGFIPSHSRYNPFENVLRPSNVAGLGLAWSYTTGRPVGSSPAVANGVVYVGAYDHKVYALDASTGQKLWSTAAGSFVYSSPAVANGVVYVGSNHGEVFALDASTGQKLWSYATGNSISSSPAVANGVVYVGSNDYPGDGKVYALDASTSKKLWSYTTGFFVGSSPAVANGHVYIGSGDGKVYAFGLATNHTDQAMARPKAMQLRPNRSLRPQH